MRLLVSGPIEAAAIDDIVQEAGVAKGSFYNHFDDKVGFQHAIIQEVRSQVAILVGEVNQGVADPARRVARAVCVYIRHAITDPERSNALLQIESHALYASAPLNRRILEDVSQGLLAGRFAIPNVEAGVLFIVGVARVALVRVHAERNPAVTVVLGQQLCSLLLRGLGVAASEADVIAAQAAHEVVNQPLSEL